MFEKKPFGAVDGKLVELYTLTNANGLKASIMTYGGTMIQLLTPDRNGKMADILLGYDNLDGFVKNSPYFNCLIGRYGNRIAKGKFTLDGKTYSLAVNNGENSLHGGLQGFDKVIWDAEPFEDENGAAVKLTYISKDMEEGYPGTLTVTVIYTLTHKNELTIDYTAGTDKTTVCNLTNHNYYNLTGSAKTTILGHILTINADRFVPINKQQIPTGQILAVKGTPMDFTQPTEIGGRIDGSDPQLEFGFGYDHTWVLNKKGSELSWAATLVDPQSGRQMEVWTQEPGVQFYAGNFLDSTMVGKGGIVYQRRFGMCLETQHYPDSPNQPAFPTTTLRPGEIYKTRTVHKFSAC